MLSSPVDCNSLLYGINLSLLDKLQNVLHAAARLVLKKLKFDHISDDIRDELHWLPVKQSISFTICMYCTYASVFTMRHLLTSHFCLGCRCSAAPSFHRSSRVDSIVPRIKTRIKTVRYGDRSYVMSGRDCGMLCLLN